MPRFSRNGKFLQADLVWNALLEATGCSCHSRHCWVLMRGTTWKTWAFSPKIMGAASDQAWVSGQAQMETATEFSSGALLMKARKTHLCWAICSQCLVVQEGSSSLEFGNLRRALHLQWPGTSVWNCSVASFTPWQYSQKWPSKSWRRKWRSGQGQVFQKQRLFVVFSN